MSAEKSSRNSAHGRFTSSVVAVCVVVGAGFAVQLTLGGFNIAAIASPVNLFLGAAMVLVCVAMAMFADTRFVAWFTGVPMAVCLISALGALALIMGLTPQGATPAGGMARVSARLGFNSMTSSWPFVLVYLALLMSLGGLVARRVAGFRWRDWGFYLNHVGLWLALFAAGLGYADIERYIVKVDEGATVTVGTDPATSHPVMLPASVMLHDFTMEEYPPARLGARPMPKYFASEVELTLADGTSVRGTTEVNHPLRAGDMLVYQYGYDREAGTASAYSVVEIVRDPWLRVVYAGFAMIALGAVAMIWRGRKRQ
jgi:hypothetical protein